MIGGVGIGLRKPHYEALLETERRVEWLEFVPENFLTTSGFRAHYLDRIGEKYSLIPHGVALSVGGPDPLDRQYLERLKALVRRVGAPYFSDHLCFARGLGVDFYDLLPLPFSEDAVHYIARRAKEAMDFIERPLMLENITYYAEMPGARMSEGQFIRAVLEESGAGLLLDVNNTYLNAMNHGRNPSDVLFELPLERAGQIHIAGHVKDGDILLDNHGAPIIDAVFELYEQAIARIGPIPTLLEWDTHIPSLDEVLDEADRVSQAYSRGVQRYQAARGRDDAGVSHAIS